MKQISLLIIRVKAMKVIYNKIWMLALLLLPSALMAQVTERQAGDTTYYKTLIPEDKTRSAEKYEYDSKHAFCSAK